MTYREKMSTLHQFFKSFHTNLDSMGNQLIHSSLWKTPSPIFSFPHLAILLLGLLDSPHELLERRFPIHGTGVLLHHLWLLMDIYIPHVMLGKYKVIFFMTFLNLFNVIYHSSLPLLLYCPSFPH